MNFELSEEQLLIRESVVKLCADFPDDYWSKKDTEHEFPWDFYEAMAEAGWLELVGGSWLAGADWPERIGRSVWAGSKLRCHYIYIYIYICMYIIYIL